MYGCPVHGSAGNSPQLAVATEPVEGIVLAVMPSSYRDSPGPACLLVTLFVRKMPLITGSVL